MANQEPSPAERAAERASEALRRNLEARTSFVFEAGAGAGKTYSLIEALKYLISQRGREFARAHKQIACITYTNVARDTITERIDGNPIVFCDTTHAFAWSLISQFQRPMWQSIPSLSGWNQRQDDLAHLVNPLIEYALGRRKIEDGKVLLHHDDIFPLMIELLKSAKFRSALASRFPVILIDEYQDTNAALVEALKVHVIGKPGAPQFGFFGDHWQKIYGDGCGSISHEALQEIEKGANFRSATSIVTLLNRMRPELQQMPKDESVVGSVQVFHTNGWLGTRQTRNHWQGDLPSEALQKAVSTVKQSLVESGWDLSAERTKVLMLTHRALATEMGYASLVAAFRYNDSFTRKQDDFIAYFVDHLEPAYEAFRAGQYGLMFRAIDAVAPTLNSPAEKARWSSIMRRVGELRGSGTVEALLSHLESAELPILSDKVIALRHAFHLAAQGADEATTGLSTERVSELRKLFTVPYTEIQELSKFLRGSSPFQTKHGVKGDEFENVLVVFGRGWNDYDFNAFLTMWGSPTSIGANVDAYERYRNLFYVACSRPKLRLSLLFTQRLSDRAVSTLSDWVAPASLTDIGRSLR